jgi:type III secretory pathway component EscR
MKYHWGAFLSEFLLIINCHSFTLIYNRSPKCAMPLIGPHIIISLVFRVGLHVRFCRWLQHGKEFICTWHVYFKTRRMDRLTLRRSSKKKKKKKKGNFFDILFTSKMPTVAETEKCRLKNDIFFSIAYFLLCHVFEWLLTGFSIGYWIYWLFIGRNYK